MIQSEGASFLRWYIPVHVPHRDPLPGDGQQQQKQQQRFSRRGGAFNER